MENWLDIPADRKRLPIVRLCLILALTALVMLGLLGRKSHAADLLQMTVSHLPMP
ncbi:MAG: hypothetical protein ACJASV_000593 [Pseudorhodobacter sp.]|jgi:hypothetical protein